jgi:hypothetical protein
LKTYKEYLNPTFYIYAVHGPIVPHTKSGRLVSHRRRIDYVVKFIHALAIQEVELGKFSSLNEAGVYAHWILTNPNCYYELKDLAVDPRRTSAHISFIREPLDGENFRYRAVLSSLVKVPEKKEEEKAVESPTEALKHPFENSSELREEEVAASVPSALKASEEISTTVKVDWEYFDEKLAGSLGERLEKLKKAP